MLGWAAMTALLAAAVMGKHAGYADSPAVSGQDATHCLLCELCPGIAATFAAAAVPFMAIPVIPAALLLNRQLLSSTASMRA